MDCTRVADCKAARGRVSVGLFVCIHRHPDCQARCHPEEPRLGRTRCAWRERCCIVGLGRMLSAGARIWPPNCSISGSNSCYHMSELTSRSHRHASAVSFLAFGVQKPRLVRIQRLGVDVDRHLVYTPHLTVCIVTFNWKIAVSFSTAFIILSMRHLWNE